MAHLEARRANHCATETSVVLLNVNAKKRTKTLKITRNGCDTFHKHIQKEFCIAEGFTFDPQFDSLKAILSYTILICIPNVKLRMQCSTENHPQIYRFTEICRSEGVLRATYRCRYLYLLMSQVDRKCRKSEHFYCMSLLERI